MFRQRLLLTFSADGDIRFLSHHDVMRVLERAVRRASLPVASSQGFNPRPRIAILQARAVGVASDSEFVEMDFDGWVGPENLRRTLAAQLPEGLRLLNVALGDPTQHALVASLEYRVDFRQRVPFSPIDVAALLDGPAILVSRQRKGRTKTVDLKPVLAHLHLSDNSLIMKFRVTDQGSARPEEILQALGMSIDDVHRHCALTRTAMTLDLPSHKPQIGR